MRAIGRDMRMPNIYISTVKAAARNHKTGKYNRD